MSTFAGLQRAYSGLSAAQRAMEVAGHNISNVGVDGYTRQRTETSSVGAPAQVGRIASSPGVGQGVSVEQIARLGNAQLDARVRGTAAVAGQAETVAAGLAGIENIFREPGTDGLSALLSDYWNAWDGVASNPGEAPAASQLFQSAQGVADRLASMHSELSANYTAQHRQLSNQVQEVNATAQSVAALNQQIRSAGQNGHSPNELLDERDRLTAKLSELTGAEVRPQSDGSVDVVLGGTQLVTGNTARSLQVSGSAELAQGQEIQVNWTHREADRSQATITSGAIAGSLTMLAGAEEDGTGGPIAQTAAVLDDIARDLAERTNTAHAEGHTAQGEPGAEFFTIGTGSAAASLQVALGSAQQLAHAAPGAGPLDGHNASRLSSLGELNDGPDAMWGALVSGVGAQVRNASLSSVNAATSYVSAVEAQRSRAGVSLDEENLSLLQNQYAYQGAARVMTAIDQMLDTLINRTGLVGR